MLEKTLSEIAADHGCVGFGVTTAEPFDGLAGEMASRKTAGLAANLAFTYRDPSVAADVRRTFPWAERLVALAFAYQPDAGRAQREAGAVRIARFADGDHYVGLRLALTAVAGHISKAGYRAEILSDDTRLVDRAVAVRAGMAWSGRSAMALVPGAGPWVLLGSVVTDAPLAIGKAMERSCGTCVACIPACPTGAILDHGVIDVRRCLAYVLQAPGVIPIELRDAVEDRLYGCDDCLTACPPGSRILETTVPTPGPEIIDILGSTDRELLERYGHFYLPGRRPRILRRNAIVAAGNDGSADLEPIVIGYAGHPDWLLRAHAAWAIGVFGSAVGLVALERALDDERDGRVRSEIHLAKERWTTKARLR